MKTVLPQIQQDDTAQTEIPSFCHRCLHSQELNNGGWEVQSGSLGTGFEAHPPLAQVLPVCYTLGRLASRLYAQNGKIFLRQRSKGKSCNRRAHIFHRWHTPPAQEYGVSLRLGSVIYSKKTCKAPDGLAYSRHFIIRSCIIWRGGYQKVASTACPGITAYPPPTPSTN